MPDYTSEGRTRGKDERSNRPGEGLARRPQGKPREERPPRVPALPIRLALIHEDAKSSGRSGDVSEEVRSLAEDLAAATIAGEAAAGDAPSGRGHRMVHGPLPEERVKRPTLRRARRRRW